MPKALPTQAQEIQAVLAPVVFDEMDNLKQTALLALLSEGLSAKEAVAEMARQTGGTVINAQEAMNRLVVRTKQAAFDPTIVDMEMARVIRTISNATEIMATALDDLAKPVQDEITGMKMERIKTMTGVSKELRGLADTQVLLAGLRSEKWRPKAVLEVRELTGGTPEQQAAVQRLLAVVPRNNG